MRNFSPLYYVLYTKLYNMSPTNAMFYSMLGKMGLMMTAFADPQSGLTQTSTGSGMNAMFPLLLMGGFNQRRSRRSYRRPQRVIVSRGRY